MGVLTQYGSNIGRGIDSALVNKIGSAPLNTTAQDLSGAINELNTNLENAATKQYVDTTVDTAINQVVTASY